MSLGSWRSVIVGVALGAAAVATGLAAYVHHVRVSASADESAASPGALAVTAHPDRLDPFDTAIAVLGAALVPPPVTARVTTVESRTSPSFAPLDGRVVEVNVKLGDPVKEGTRLVKVSSGALATMSRELHSAELAIRTKQALVDRLTVLVEAHAASGSDLTVATSELDEAKLAASTASARLRSLTVERAGESSYWVLAARAGVVVQLDAMKGKEVGPDKDKPVATVADLDEVLVVSDVPQGDADALKVGMRVFVRPTGESREPVAGTIEVVSAILDPERQTVPIRVRVSNVGRALRPNQFVEAAFASGDSRQVLVVPAEAVVSDGASSFVFVSLADGHVRKRAVHLGQRAREQVEILSGIAPGERVVVRGAALLLNAIDVEG